MTGKRNEKERRASAAFLAASSSEAGCGSQKRKSDTARATQVSSLQRCDAFCRCRRCRRWPCGRRRRIGTCAFRCIDDFVR